MQRRPRPALVRALLDYNPKTGLFRWKAPTSRQARGWFKGSKGLRKYRRIWIFGRAYLAHHIAHVIMLGTWPRIELDHKNRNQGNNRWRNLRPLGHRGNTFNRTINKNNKTGFRGVSVYGSRFRASITCDRKYISLGLFDTPKAAAKAYGAAARKLYGDAYAP